MGNEPPLNSDDPDGTPKAERVSDAAAGPQGQIEGDGTPQAQARSEAPEPGGAAAGRAGTAAGPAAPIDEPADTDPATPASGQAGTPQAALTAEHRPDRTLDASSAAEQHRPGTTPMPGTAGGGSPGRAPGSPVAVVPGMTPGASSPAAPPPGGLPPGAAGPGVGQHPGAAPVPYPSAPSWASYGRPMGGVQDGYDPRLHSRYWEAQLEAGARSSLHWGFLAFFLGWGGYYLTGMLLSVVMSGRFENFDQLDPPPLGPLLLLSLLPNLFLGLGPAVLSWWKGSGTRRDFGIVPKWRDVWVGLSCGGAGLLGAFIVALMVMGDAVENGDESAISGMGALFEGQAIWVFCLALFMFIGAPLTEELLVRGALWGALEHFKVPRYAVLLLTTFVFALIHEEPMRTPILLVGGLAMGIARMITGRVSAAIIAHAAYNFLPALIFYTQFS
ncbi:hypothetical protein FHR81_001568 [Actinoalloteichus hoggarensis]|uniref:CAAX amino terminal protease self-immunity n=1 Tax=Actinoalloteichus hoggarensis TaxID=1470176 RepID=A0A221W0M0_9PSEU|nr:CPBP family intramembrane glutamic endopeptidase [Actinoalloteichus hoggarensis]ASO19300.1 CAAX amino terminal protease self- immunity [Actinoalloteichus hoggarensis]MBB5920538.1 hypothetical protein [Actinoalloteichus hoggarensis]